MHLNWARKIYMVSIWHILSLFPNWRIYHRVFKVDVLLQKSGTMELPLFLN